jgi:hypothetical protein
MLPKMTLRKEKGATSRGRVAFGILAVLLASLLLAACGEEVAPTPLPPTPTPPPRFQQERNTELQFEIAVPYGWRKETLDSQTVLYVNPADPNAGIGVVSRRITNLNPDNKDIIRERVDFLKSRFPALRQDAAGGGSLTLVDTTVGIDRLIYTNERNTEVIQYVTQVNNVRAQRGYVLYAATPSTPPETAEANRKLYLEAFATFSSTAPEVPRGQSGVADPTIVAANNGGKVIASPQQVLGKYLRLSQWETPPLNAPTKTPKLTGLFPVNYGWKIGFFPTRTQPAISLESPLVDESGPEAVIQMTTYAGALPAGAPSRDDWNKFINPARDAVVQNYIQKYGPVTKLGDLGQVGDVYRLPFKANDDLGKTLVTGYVYFSKNGTNGIVTFLSLSQKVAIKQALVESFDADLRQMLASLAVKP